MKRVTIRQILDAEIKWCLEHADGVTEEYRNGFIDGLIQAKNLLTKASQIESGRIPDGVYNTPRSPQEGK